ncbi:MAG: DUF3592 domain-containing protein [Leptolyngbyaceae bacterium]|nr:DUF3592 domain-containing protein [Leptolyngbyaceae bacterium]
MASPNPSFQNISRPTMIFVGLGLALIATGVAMGGFARERTRNLPSVPGTVVNLMTFSSGRGTCQAPVVAYAVDGDSYQVTPQSAHSCHFLPPSVGDAIDVFYLEANPADARLHHVSVRWVVPGIFVVTGLFLGGIGGAVSLMVDRTVGRSPRLSPRSTHRPLKTSDDAYTLEDIEALAVSGRKIEAIKAYRELYSVSLKAAKIAVEKMQ